MGEVVSGTNVGPARAEFKIFDERETKAKLQIALGGIAPGEVSAATEYARKRSTDAPNVADANAGLDIVKRGGKNFDVCKLVGWSVGWIWCVRSVLCAQFQAGANVPTLNLSVNP